MELRKIMVACGLWSMTVVGAAAQGLSGPANEQDPAPPAGEARELTNAELTRELAAMQQNLRKMTTSMDAIIDHVNANKDTPQRIADLELKLMEYSTVQQEMMATLKDIQKSLQQQTPDGEGEGERITTFRPLIENADLRQQLAKAIQSEMPTQGIFHVENTTELDRTIEINQTEFVIPAKKARSFRVAVGTVTTQLPGEPMMTWAISAPSYDQRIQIVPKAQPTIVGRPITADSIPTLYPPRYESDYYYPW